LLALQAREILENCPHGPKYFFLAFFQVLHENLKIEIFVGRMLCDNLPICIYIAFGLWALLIVFQI
jgi:hypothetical protein